MKQYLFFFLVFLNPIFLFCQNVGIGTLSPMARLHIVGVTSQPVIPSSTASTGIFRINGQTVGDALDIGKSNTMPYSAWLQSGFDSNSDPLSLQPLGGNVGIGLLSPSEKLEVKGGIKADSINVSSGRITNVGEPLSGQDASTKSYVDNLLLSFGISIGSAGIQGLLDAGYSPSNIINEGADISSFMGLTYAGGLIFYVKPDGTGLVAAPIDAPVNLAWGNEVGLGGGCNQFATGATGLGIEDGEANTMTVLASECDSTGSAFNYVDTLSLGNYEDWFLPSKDELYEMYKNLHRNKCSAAPPGGVDGSTCDTSLGGFSATFYWSSSEFIATNAWSHNFINGFQSNAQKINVDGVRAIRAF